MNWILFAIEILVWLFIFSQAQIILKLSALIRDSTSALKLFGINDQIAVKENFLRNKKYLVVLSIINQIVFFFIYEDVFGLYAVSIILGSLAFCFVYVLLCKSYSRLSSPKHPKPFYVLPRTPEAYGYIFLPVLSVIIWLVAF